MKEGYPHVRESTAHCALRYRRAQPKRRPYFTSRRWQFFHETGKRAGMDAAEYKAALHKNCKEGIKGACEILERHGYRHDEV